jgi:predicted thioesterase
MYSIAGINVGSEAEATTVVTPEVTVRHFHANMPEVYGTPFMIYLMEVAAHKAVHLDLPDGWVTVGVDVNIRHLAPTTVGRTVTARAKVTGVTDKLIEFEVQAHDGVKLIGRGTHTRAPIDLARFQRALSSESV